MTETKRSPARGGTLDTTKKKRIFLFVYKKNSCNITKACAATPIGRRTYYRWIEGDKNFLARVEEQNESLVDWGEDMLKKRMKEGDTTAIIFFLKTKGRKRGYAERYEHSGEVFHTLRFDFGSNGEGERE